MSGLACFDLDTFLTMTERTRKWQCPHSMRHMSVRELHIDPYVARLLLFLKVAGLRCLSAQAKMRNVALHSRRSSVPGELMCQHCMP